MAYEQEKKFLAETEAIRVSYGANPHTGAIELVRRFTVSRSALQSSCLEYLNTIKHVNKPKADRCEYPGIFRVVRNTATFKKGMSEQEQGITQTLRLLGTGDYAWLSGHTTLDESYSYAYRDKEAPIQAQTTEQGMTADAQNTLNENNLYDAEAKLTRSNPYQWTTRSTEGALGYGDDISYKNWRYQPQAPSGTVKGTVYDARSSLNRDGTYDGGVGSKTSREAAWSETTSTILGDSVDNTYLNYRVKPSAPAALAVGYVYSPKFTLNADGTYTGGIGYEYSRPAQWHDAVETVMDRKVGYTYRNQRTKPTAPANTALGYVYDARSTLNRDGTYDGETGYQYSKPAQWVDVTSTVTNIKADYSYLNQRAKPVAPSGTVVGCVYETKSTLNRDGTYNGGVGYNYSLPTQWYDVSDSVLMTDVGYSYKNQRTRPTGPAALVVGSLYNASSVLNPDGTYDGKVGHQYAKPAQWVDAVESVTGKTVDHTYRNYRTKPAAPTSTVQGYLYNARSTLNKDGTYDGNTGYEYSKPAQWADVTESALASSVALTYLNHRTRPSAPTSTVQGVLYDIRSTLNKDGTYGGVLSYETSKSASWADRTENALELNVSNSVVNYRTKLTAPAASVQGYLYEARNTLAKDGTYFGNSGYSYSKPLVLSGQVTSSSMVAGYEVAYLNSRTHPVTPAATIGTVYDAKGTLNLNKDGTYTGNIGYQCSVPQEMYITWATGDGGGRRGFYKYSNWRTLPSTINSLTAYTDNSVDAGYNRDGSIDATIRIREPQGGLTAGPAVISTAKQTQDVREVLGYNSDTEMWIVQMWKRNEQYFKSKNDALDATSGTDHEKVSVTYASIAGGYWLAVWWVREGSATEKSTSDGT